MSAWPEMSECRKWASGTSVREFRDHLIERSPPVRQRDVERFAQLGGIEHRPRRARGLGGIFIGADGLHSRRLLDEIGGLRTLENDTCETAPTGSPRRDQVI